MIRSGKDELIEITISSLSFTPAKSSTVKKSSPLTTYPDGSVGRLAPQAPRVTANWYSLLSSWSTPAADPGIDSGDR